MSDTSLHNLYLKIISSFKMQHARTYFFPLRNQFLLLKCLAHLYLFLWFRRVWVRCEKDSASFWGQAYSKEPESKSRNNGLIAGGSRAFHVTLRTLKTSLKTATGPHFGCNMVSSLPADSFSCMSSPRLDPVYP